MSISVVEPVGSAIERSRLVCFQPFDLGKWFVIGFCAFLAGFAEGGGGNVPSFNYHTPGGKGVAEEVRSAIDWIQSHLIPILLIGSVVLILGIALGAVFTWLGTRGQFMLIENIVRNRGAVVAPWNEYRKEGNSLFWFRFLFGLVVFATFLAIPIGAILIALPDIQAKTFGPYAGIALAVFITGFLLVGILSGLVLLFLNDFVVPIMFLRRMGVIEAWQEFRTSLLAGNVGTFTLYVLFKIVISIAVGLMMTMLVCCTFCIAAIPYLGTAVILLPFHVFWRSYSLAFLEQFGPEWRFFSRANILTAEPLDEEDDWSEERIRPGEEDFRRDDDEDLPPDSRFRPE